MKIKLAGQGLLQMLSAPKDFTLLIVQVYDSYLICFLFFLFAGIMLIVVNYLPKN